jgi:exonuclease VII small subunit
MESNEVVKAREVLEEAYKSRARALAHCQETEKVLKKCQDQVSQALADLAATHKQSR